MAAKDTEIGTWSDWSVAVHATPWMDQPKQITSTTDTGDTLGMGGRGVGREGGREVEGSVRRSAGVS